MGRGAVFGAVLVLALLMYGGVAMVLARGGPDGEWLVFTQSHSFMLLQPDSKLHILPAEGGEPRLMNANTNRMNSWHSWSPNSKWLVFSSKVFSPYTQLFLTHIDEDGNDTPPVLLRNFTATDRAANIPEFVNIDPASTRSIREMFVDDYNYFRSGRIYEQFSEFDRAEEEFIKSLEANPGNTSSLYSLGTMYAEREDFEEAERIFKEIVRLDPGDAIVHKDLGSLYFSIGRHNEAKTEFQTAVRLDPGNVAARFNLGIAYRALNNLDRAREQFEAIVASNPTNIDARNELGRILVQKREFQLALSEFDAVIERDARNLFALMHMARVYQELQRYSDAERVLVTIIGIEPNNVFARVDLGRVYGETRQYAKAVAEFRSALEINPNDPRVYFMLGEALAREDRSLSEAMNAYSSGLRLDPTSREAHISLGEICLRAGDTQGATKAFEAALGLNPSATDRQYLEAQLADLRSRDSRQ